MIRWKIRFAFILIVQFVAVLCVTAQEPAGEVDLSQPLTLEQCIQIGLERSTNMRNARLNLAIQELRIKNARAAYFPRIFSSAATTFPTGLISALNQKTTIWDNRAIYTLGQRAA